MKNVKFLTYFNIASNRIKILDKKLFFYQDNLRYLNISYNPVSSISKLTFSGLSNIKQFNISGTSVSILCDYCLAGFSHVYHLEVTHNAIALIQGQAFANMTYLKLLVIKNNKIQQFDIVFLELLPRSAVLKTDESGMCCEINKLFGLHCTHNRMTKSFCLSWHIQPLWYCFVFLAILFNILAMIVVSTNKTDVFSVWIRNLSLSYILLVLHYGFRIFLNYDSVKIAMSSNTNFLKICRVSAVIFPLSQLIQVSFQFVYSFSYLLLVVNSYRLLTLRKAYCVSFLLWILSLAVAYMIQDIGGIFEDLCIAYSTNDNQTTWLFAYLLLIITLGHDIITIYAIFKAAQIRKYSQRETTRKEMILKWRMIIQMVVNFLYFGFVGILYVIISSQLFVNQTIIEFMDCSVVFKSTIDPILYTFTATSKWKKPQKV